MSEPKKRKKGQSKKTSAVRRIAWILLKCLTVALLLFVLSLIGLNAYLKSNKTKIFSQIEILNDGSFSFERADIQVFKDFPSATISIENMELRDARFESHGRPILKLRELAVAASLQKLFDHEVEINSVRMAGGSIAFFSDENGYSNLKSFFPEKENSEKPPGDKGLNILTDNLDLSLSDMDFHLSNAVKTSNIRGRLKEVNAVLQLTDKKLEAEIDLALFMKGLTMKESKGPFVANSDLSGNVELEIKDGVLSFAPFELAINEEAFLFSGRYDTNKKSISTLILENENTRLEKTTPLVPDHIKEKLNRFTVDGPFFSKTTISGFFRPNEPPLVTVDFKLDNDDASANGHIFNGATLRGHIVNRLYQGARAEEENGKSFLVSLFGVSAMHQGFSIHAPKILVRTMPGHEPKVKTEIWASGRPSSISKFLENDKFFFRGGTFNLNAKVEGPLTNFNVLLIDSEAHLELEDFSVIYDPSNTSFPFHEMTLYKKRGDADFSILSSTVKNRHDFLIDGGMDNMHALLFAMAERVSSEVNFTADKMGWTDFLDLFGENGYLDDGQPKNDGQKKQSMKKTIRGVQYNFQPRLSVSVDTLQYFDLLELHQFRTGVHFENENTVVLEKTSFEYGAGNVRLWARLDIGKANITPFEFELHAEKINLATLLPPLDYFNIKLLSNIDKLPENVSIDIKHRGIMDDQKGLIPSTSTGEIVFKLDAGETLLGKVNYEPAAWSGNYDKAKLELGNSVKTKIALDGQPRLFNSFLKNEQFFFDKGHFFAQFDYEGDVTDFGELLNEADATFQLHNSEVYFQPADITFPLTEINLELHRDNAFFHALIKSDSFRQEINLNGDIQNISELVVGKTEKEIKTTVEVTSPKVDWAQFLGLFSKPGNDTTDLRDYTLKATTKGILSAFNPDLSVYLDTFVYSDKLIFHQVQTGLSLQDTATLVLDQTGFRFHDGNVGLNGTLNLGIKNSTPFTGHFMTDKLDVARLLESLNYLELPSLKNLEKLSGQTTMNLDLRGTIANDGVGLVPEDTRGLLDFELRNIRIKGYAPLDALAAKIRMKKRFEELSFAPISNQVEIKGEDIEIPLMEIQSNAINMFLEGTFSYGDNTNLWVSIPLDNLKSADRSVLPEKRGYEATKRKIYIEVTTDEKGENKLKFHLRKKKFYKQRGMPKQFRADKRKYRKMRKEGH